MFCGERQKSCAKFHRVVFLLLVWDAVNHMEDHRSDPREWCQGRKPLEVWGCTLMDFISSWGAPGSGLHPMCLIKSSKVPPAPKRQFLCPKLQTVHKTGVDWKRKLEGRKGLGLPFEGSMLSSSPGLIKFIMGRGFQNGFGEFFSTLFTLTFQNISEAIHSDFLRKFKEWWIIWSGVSPSLGYF